MNERNHLFVDQGMERKASTRSAEHQVVTPLGDVGNMPDLFHHLQRTIGNQAVLPCSVLAPVLR